MQKGICGKQLWTGQREREGEGRWWVMVFGWTTLEDLSLSLSSFLRSLLFSFSVFHFPRTNVELGPAAPLKRDAVKEGASFNLKRRSRIKNKNALIERHGYSRLKVEKKSCRGRVGTRENGMCMYVLLL